MSRENLEVARLWWARFNKDGLPPLDLCDERIEIRNPDGFPVTGPYYGHEGVRQWASDVYDVLEDARVEPEEVVEVGDGEAVIAVLRQTGRWKYTQLASDVRWAAIMTMRDGKLAHAQGYVSKTKALEAAGLRE
jgi:ketosteroid isomerase-like protein